MIKASALALAALSPTHRGEQANLLPALSDIRAVSLHVARAVGKQAIQEGVADVDEAGFEAELAANVWDPVYQPYERVR